MRKLILFLAAVSLVLFAEKALCYETTFSIEPRTFNSFRYEEMRVEEAAPLSIRRGRFLSVDPVLDLKQATRSPQAWNRYTYVLNNPVRFTDPTGKYTCTGSKDECKAFEASMGIVRAAAAEATRKKLPGAAALNDVVKHYGKAGEDNGVGVTL